MLSNLFKQMQIKNKKQKHFHKQWVKEGLCTVLPDPKGKKKKKVKKKYIYTELKTDFQITISLDHCLVALANDKYS